MMFICCNWGQYVCRDDADPFIRAWRGPSTNRLPSFCEEERPQLPMSHSSIAPGFALRGALWAAWLRWRSGKAKQLLVEAKCPCQPVPILETLRKHLGQRILTLFTIFRDLIASFFQGQGGYSSLPFARKRKQKPLLQVFLANAYFCECMHTSRLPPWRILLGT